MAQLSLFDQEPPVATLPAPEPRKLCRKDGPETSKQAAEEIVHKLADIQKWALACVEDCPHKTASEICQEIGIGDIRKLNRRLPELEDKGLVQRSASPRACTVTGKSAYTWAPTGKRGSRI